MLHQLRSAAPRMLVTIVIAASLACAPRTGPSVAAEQWLRALAAQDGASLSELTCTGAQGVAQHAAALSALIGIFSATVGREVQPRLSVDDLSYQVTLHDRAAADVRIKGPVRIAAGGFTDSRQIDLTVRLVREDDRWRACGVVLSAGPLA